MAIAKGPQVCPRSEFLRRLTAVKAEMDRLEIDTLIVGNSSDITYRAIWLSLAMCRKRSCYL